MRRLGYGDLPSVISIERRSFPTPWSLAMFVLELSKPSGICLGAEEEGLGGYLACARYDDVWHLMNVAVHPERRRQGIARELIERFFEEAGPGGGSPSRSGCQTRPRSRCTSASASAPPAAAAATTTTTARTP